MKESSMSEAQARHDARVAYRSASRWLMVCTGLAILGYGLAVHMPDLPYTTDELQYLLWSKDLAWGYFSKPPGIAFALSLWTVADPHAEHLRWFAQLCYALSLVISFRLLRDEGLSTEYALLGTLALGTMPFIGFAQWFFTTDALLLICWLLALAIAWRAWTATCFRRSAIWWALLGVVIAAGMLCKHFMLFFWVGLGVHFALLQDRTRWQLYGLAICFLSFVWVLSPHIFWLVEHPGTTLKHLADLQSQGMHGSDLEAQGKDGLSVLRRLMQGAEFLGAQWLGLGLGIVLLLRRAAALSGLQRMWLAHSVPVLLMFVVQATISRAYANWALPASFTLGLTMISYVLRAQGESGPAVELRRRPDTVFYLSVWVAGNLLTSLVLAFAAPALKASRPDLQMWVDRMDPFHRQRGWDALLVALTKLNKPAAIPWGVSDRDTAARIAHRFGENQLFYRGTPGSKPNHYAIHYSQEGSDNTLGSRKPGAQCTWFLARESQLTGSQGYAAIKRVAIARLERQRLSGRSEAWLVWPEACDKS